MNFIELFNQFFLLDLEYSFTPKEVAIYFRLVDRCNTLNWKNPFGFACDELRAKIKSTNAESTTAFDTARNRLKQVGLIDFKKGNGRGHVTQYTLKIVKKPVEKGVQNRPLSANLSADLSTPLSAPTSINETKGNEESKSHCGAGAPGRPKIEKTKHWKALVATWSEYYEKKFSLKPSITGAAAKNLKSILLRLEKHPRPPGAEWSEVYAKRVLTRFLEKAYDHSDWMRQNFLLENLSQKFDAIVNPNNNGSHQQTPAVKPAGKSAGANQLLGMLHADLHAISGGAQGS